MKTPTQKMMIWALENVQSYLDKNIEIDESLDAIFDETFKFE